MSELNFMHENISGIYNYCDRWCEKCSYTNRCLLFKREAEMQIRHILKEEKPNDLEVVAKDVSDNLEEVMDLFNQKADDTDFLDYDEDDDYEEEDDDDDEDFDKFLEEQERESDEQNKSFNPLIHLSEEMFKELETYYNVVKKNYPKEVGKYDTENPLIKNLQILSGYIPQISVKIHMCFWGKKQTAKAKSKLSKEIEEGMLNVSSRIAYVGIQNCLAVLNEILAKSKELENETRLFLFTLKMIKKMFVEEFPKGQTYKRPYFD